MRGVSNWAVAVRLPADHPDRPGQIAVSHEPFRSVLTRHRLLRLPVVRGSVALVESMGVGVRALGMSANAQAPADAKEQPLSGLPWVLTIAAGLGLAVGLFFLLPATLVKVTFGSSIDGLEFVLIEKAVRLTIFFAYIAAVARLPHLQRVFEYHGAEHKAIACLESGAPLRPENAQNFSRLHPRCGTSFLLIVMLVS
ncbi:MAG: DUF1385 domain-containing protein, partial [Solirubrobacteraceae bacterium]|nr:DUF1385 domain-containing protein [Patulibacter sp.]